MFKEGKDQIETRPSLYFQIARSNGYSVIQFQSHQGFDCVFSTNCKLQCRLDSAGREGKVCKDCGEELNLYRDPVMAKFTFRVRIDLQTSQFCPVPTFKHSWQHMQSIEKFEISYLKYFKALSKLSEPDVKECLANCFNYQVMPLPIPRSYWKDCVESEAENFCLLVKENQMGLFEEIDVIIGQNLEYRIKLETEMKAVVRDCQLKCNFLLLILEVEETYLLVYELPVQNEGQKEPIPAIHKIKLATKTIYNYSIQFHNQTVSILCIEMDQQAFKSVAQLKIQNILKKDLQISHLSIENQLQGLESNQKCFPFIYWSNEHLEGPERAPISFLRLNQLLISISVAEKMVSVQNSVKMGKIDGMIENLATGKLYFYELHQNWLNCLIFQKFSMKLSLRSIESQNFIRQNEGIALETKRILFKRPSIDGCFLNIHFQRQEGLFFQRTCVL